MRILTQNILKCNVNECITKDIPLKVILGKSQIIEEEFNKPLVQKSLKRMDWKNLKDTAQSLGENDIPDQLDDQMLDNDEFLQKMHNIIFQFHIMEAQLLCENCKKQYPVKNGIPNLLLEANEI